MSTSPTRSRRARRATAGQAAAIVLVACLATDYFTDQGFTASSLGSDAIVTALITLAVHLSNRRWDRKHGVVETDAS